MLIMGLPARVLAASWLTVGFAVFTSIAILVTILLGYTLLQRTSLSLLFVFLWLFMLSLIPFAFLVSVFFSKAKLAGIFGPVVLFIMVTFDFPK